MSETLITATLAAVTATVENVWKISKDIHKLIEGIQNAPEHVKAISQDVRGLYLVLESLQRFLCSIEGAQFSPAAMLIFESLDDPLKNCSAALLTLKKKISRFTKSTGSVIESILRRTRFLKRTCHVNGSIWRRTGWFFTEKHTDAYRDHLAGYKSIINITLGAANLENVTQDNDATEKLIVKVVEMLKHSITGEVGSQAIHRYFALERFLRAIETVPSESLSGSPPILSLRASSVFVGPRLSSTRTNQGNPRQQSDADFDPQNGQSINLIVPELTVENYVRITLSSPLQSHISSTRENIRESLPSILSSRSSSILQHSSNVILQEDRSSSRSNEQISRTNGTNVRKRESDRCQSQELVNKSRHDPCQQVHASNGTPNDPADAKGRATPDAVKYRELGCNPSTHSKAPDNKPVSRQSSTSPTPEWRDEESGPQRAQPTPYVLAPEYERGFLNSPRRGVRHSYDSSSNAKADSSRPLVDRLHKAPGRDARTKKTRTLKIQQTISAKGFIPMGKIPEKTTESTQATSTRLHESSSKIGCVLEGKASAKGLHGSRERGRDDFPRTFIQGREATSIKALIKIMEDKRETKSESQSKVNNTCSLEDTLRSPQDPNRRYWDPFPIGDDQIAQPSQSLPTRILKDELNRTCETRVSKRLEATHGSVELVVKTGSNKQVEEPQAFTCQLEENLASRSTPISASAMTSQTNLLTEDLGIEKKGTAPSQRPGIREKATPSSQKRGTASGLADIRNLEGGHKDLNLGCDIAEASETPEKLPAPPSSSQIKPWDQVPHDYRVIADAVHQLFP